MVKASLVEANWDAEAAYEVLRVKGLAAASRKASRQASEGLIGVARAGSAAALVEVNSETDFVARNALFHKLVRSVADSVLAVGQQRNSTQLELEQDELATLQMPGGSGERLQDACAVLAAQVGENIRVRRAVLLQSPGVLGMYVHNKVDAGLGRIAALVAVEGPAGPIPEARAAAAAELAGSLAMQAVGLRAHYLSREAVPEAEAQRERQLLTEQCSGSGKPPAVVAKMVEGRMRKFYEDVCLLEQAYMNDEGGARVAAVVEAFGKAGGGPVRLAALARMQCGEGM